MACPNVNLESWKNLVVARGEDTAYYLWDKYDGNVPESESNSSIVKAGLKSVAALQSDKVASLFNTLEKNRVTGDAFWNKLQSDLQIPKEQIELLKQYNTTNREELITNMLGDYSYAIEINTAKVAEGSIDEGFERIDGREEGQTTAYYSNLTVPGGTNYTENEIATPAITPSIKGHAQFATDQGIGWFRSDDRQLDKGEKSTGSKTWDGEDENGNPIFIDDFETILENTKTRRILEVQSDLFQKGRDLDLLAEPNKDSFEIEEGVKIPIPDEKAVKDSKFLQLLNKANNWVTFFVKSIIQDSAKKGYEKVVFPTGSTAYKIESGGRTIEDFIKNKEARLEELENVKKPFAATDVGANNVYYFDTLKEAENYISKNKLDDYYSAVSSEELPYRKNSIAATEGEIKQLKREIEDAKRGASGLAATARFYEENVANVLKKQGYSPKQVTDEYGNTWNEIDIVPEREQGKILFQLEEMPASKASQETLEKVKSVIKKMGVSIETLAEYIKGNPDIDVKGVNGVADLVKKVIAFAEGREEALTEEMVHIATAILEQTNPKLITEIISKIDRFKIYKQTLEAYKNNKNYQLSNGKPDIRKIKKEAADKLIAEVIINQNDGSTEFPELMLEENQSFFRKLWNTILDIIRGMYSSSNINIFETVAGKIVGEESIGTVAQIKNGEIFFQVAKNDAVDKYVDMILDNNSKLKLFPEVKDASGKVIEKRHYKFDGKKVKETVTEKVKGGSNMPERTGLDKQLDDDKQAWGLEGHSYIENYIKQNLIDDKGYALANPTDKPIASRVSPEMAKALKDFAIELVRSYDDRPGTRFLVEVKMVNENVKGMIASTIDFKVVSPDAKAGIKIDTYDWKFTSIDKNRTEDIPWFKQGEWKQQMGEYTKMDYSYGIKPEQIGKARMIPFIMNYEYAIPGEPRSGLVPKSIEVGKLDSLKETKLYLLPVVAGAESTGYKNVDELVKSLEYQYDKLFVKDLGPEKYDVKVFRLQQISKAIRNLQMKMNFEPLAIVGESFLRDASASLKEFENLDYSKLSNDQIKSKLQELNDFKNSAEKFQSLDEVFVATYGKEGLTDENKKVLTSLEKISSQTGRMMLKIRELQGEYAMQLAVKEEIVTEQTKKDVITAEREIDIMSKTFLEGSKLSSTIMSLATKLIINAASLVNIKVSQSAKDYSPLLLALEKEAKARGVEAFDLIGMKSEKDLQLIKKIDPKFYENLREAQGKKDKQFLLDNMDVAKYDELSKEAIEKGIEELNKMQFSLDEEEDIAQRNYKIRQLKNSLDIHSDTFNGYESFRFARLFKKVMKEEKHYSKEFKEMSKIPAALNMWTYMVGLNERAREMGYLTKQGNSFFPLMEASLAQKISQGDSTFSELRDFFKDSYTVRIDEEQKFSKIDPETHKIKKQIPRLFTRTNKEVTQLSRDLNKVLGLWTRSLLEYESNRELEDTLLTLHAVEKAKGRLLVDENDSVIMEGGAPKVDVDSNKNADILETIIDDKLYGLKENSTSLGNVALSMGVSKLSNKTDEEKENTKISIKKGLETGNMLTRALAVGLKALVALPNWFGVQFQTFINAGTFYRMREFEKNNLRSTTGIGLSVIDRGLIDLIVPLNEDITKEKMRELAKEQGYIKYLSTWTFNDVMMISNSWPEKKLQIANALSFNDNAMVVNGKIVNIRQYLKKQDRNKYGLSFEERRALEKTFEDRVAELKESSSLSKIAKIENDRVVIPGVSLEELAKYRTKVVEFGRELNGQMSDTNKADYRRDTMFRSFMMFKNWMPKLISAHTLDIKKNIQLDEWQYGRTRAFVKTWAHLGLRNIGKMRAIITGTEEGLAILDEMLEAKKADYFRKNGKELQITKEEFYDLMRKELSNQMKELGLLFGLMTLLLAAKAAVPPDDADELTKNRYKWWMKLTNKVSDEIAFYYNPLSFEGMTSGSVIPSITLLSKAEKTIVHLSKEAYGYSTDNDEMMDKAHPTKYFLDLVPGPSQFNREILPIIDPELAKELGIRITAEARQR